MATESRKPPSSLIARIYKDVTAFSFVQAVRLIELARCHEDGGGARRQPVGMDGAPNEESLRFRAAANLRFPSAEILEAKADDSDKKPVTLTVSFLGLTGPTGILPRFYTEWMVRNLHNRYSSMRDFFDIFHHRLISHFYRASVKYRLPLVFERAGGSQDPISTVLHALVGLETTHLRDRQIVDDRMLLYYAGHFSRWPRSATALEQMLSDVFQQAVVVHQFQGRWLTIAAEEQTRLPSPGQPDGCFCALDRDTVIGTRCWEMQGGIRIAVGPLSYAKFRSFLPDGENFRLLFGLTRAFTGSGFDFDVQLTLLAGEIPALRLDNRQDGGSRLGWNSWLSGETQTKDRSDSVFRATAE